MVLPDYPAFGLLMLTSIVHKEPDEQNAVKLFSMIKRTVQSTPASESDPDCEDWKSWSIIGGDMVTNDIISCLQKAILAEKCTYSVFDTWVILYEIYAVDVETGTFKVSVTTGKSAKECIRHFNIRCPSGV